MKASRLCCTALLLICLCSSNFAQNSPKPQEAAGKKLTLTGLKAIPDGNYLVTIEHEGQVKRFNLRIDANNGKVVKSSHPEFAKVQASFKPHGEEGRFIGRLIGEDFVATQLWILRPDGTAAIREAPDRGEMQSAVPVKGEALETAAEKR